MGETTYGEKSVVSGRLICDSYLAAKVRILTIVFGPINGKFNHQDLIKAKSYSLSQLSDQLLSVNRVEVDFEKIPQFYDRFDDLIWLCQHNENDAYLSMRLVFQLMVLPLSKQLTNLAGNLWSRTLTGGRAERNEYLLLHEFCKQGYIVPDKSFGFDVNGGDKATSTADNNAKSKKGKKDKKPTANVENLPVNINPEDEEEHEDAAEIAPVKKAGRRKPAYAGGLVLEPKKGLYDKYVLMLDFNSLYPSIIQEYNICFTTVERHLVIFNFS
jgi:DNA polymerase alpha subunit A